MDGEQVIIKLLRLRSSQHVQPDDKTNWEIHWSPIEGDNRELIHKTAPNNNSTKIKSIRAIFINSICAAFINSICHTNAGSYTRISSNEIKAKQQETSGTLNETGMTSRLPFKHANWRMRTQDRLLFKRWKITRSFSSAQLKPNLDGCENHVAHLLMT